MERDIGALYTDMGSGKTKIMIDLIVNRDWNHILVVCPKKVIDTWVSEFQKHAPKANIDVISMKDIPTDKKVTLVGEKLRNGKSGQQVIIVNYESVWRKPFRDSLTRWKMDCIICDESHRIKGAGSKVSKNLKYLGNRSKHRYLMTGTPLAQNPFDIYAQYRFLDDRIFGTNYNNFKMNYGNFVIVPGMKFPLLDKTTPYKNLDDLHNKMFSVAFKMEPQFELPDPINRIHEFPLSPKLEKLYKEFKKTSAILLKQGVMESNNVLTDILRMQQMSSGYAPVENIETGEKKVLRIDYSRMKALKTLLLKIPDDEPVIIWARYTPDIKAIRKVCKKVGRSYSEVSGNVDEVKRWQSGHSNVLIAQIRAASEGLNLTRSRYSIYYTLTPSLGEYLQSRKRIHRPGQKRRPIYYIMMGTIDGLKTVDFTMKEALDNNKDVVDYVMDNKEW